VHVEHCVGQVEAPDAQGGRLAESKPECHRHGEHRSIALGQPLVQASDFIRAQDVCVRAGAFLGSFTPRHGVRPMRSARTAAPTMAASTA
jgi:hypothetical protein